MLSDYIARCEMNVMFYHFQCRMSQDLLQTDNITANFAENGRLFGMKTAGCSGKSATPIAAPD